MHRVILEAADDVEGWRAAARGLAAARVPAEAVVWQVGAQPTDLFAGDAPPPPPPADAPPLRVPRDFLDLAGTALLHRDPGRFGLLYALLLRLAEAPGLLQDQADPQLRRAEALRRTIRRDLHKMRAFLRFRALEEGGTPRFVAWFEPEHHILRANASFFVDRFGGMRWSILTPEASLHWDGATLAEGPGAARGDAPAGDPVETVWGRYFSAIFNPARLNTAAMLKEMPRKYWRNMPEAALVPGLVAGARARETAMLDRGVGSGRRAATPAAALHALRQEAAGCRRCPLWQPATQTVFGEGPADARIMLVGEQPGDQEDLAGRLFIGPAGQLLDRALAAAGLDRGALYLTNAVKHFRFTQRGPRRLHARPGAGEIEACRWWLGQERAILRPRLTVALGATAARSLLGRPGEIGALRGRPLRLPEGGALWVTVHPAFLLRLPDPARAEAEFAGFVADLAAARAHAATLETTGAAMAGLEAEG